MPNSKCLQLKFMEESVVSKPLLDWGCSTFPMLPASEITPFWFERLAIFLPSNVTFRSFLSLSNSSSGVDIHPEDCRERLFHLSEKLRVGTEDA